MYETHLWMLFILGIITTAGTYGGIATQYAAVGNFVVWTVFGMAAASTTVALGDGTTMTVGASALSYVAYANAIGGWLPWFVTIYEWYTEEEKQIERNTGTLEELMHGQ